MRCRLLAAIGAGGKTTALRCLARETSKGKVLFTTTTHIFPLPPSERRVLLEDPSQDMLLKELNEWGIVCAGSRAGEGKLGALPGGLLDRAISAAQLTLYEADGAQCLPLKLHRPDEPVLLPETDLCLVVAGLSALGRPVGQVIHRYERNPQWHSRPDLLVGPEEFLFCVMETVRAAGLPESRIRVLLNQADLLPEREPAAQIVQKLRDRGLDCRMGSLKKGPEFLTGWILNSQDLNGHSLEHN